MTGGPRAAESSAGFEARRIFEWLCAGSLAAGIAATAWKTVTVRADWTPSQKTNAALMDLGVLAFLAWNSRRTRFPGIMAVLGLFIGLLRVREALDPAPYMSHWDRYADTAPIFFESISCGLLYLILRFLRGAVIRVAALFKADPQTTPLQRARGLRPVILGAAVIGGAVYLFNLPFKKAKELRERIKVGMTAEEAVAIVESRPYGYHGAHHCFVLDALDAATVAECESLKPRYEDCLKVKAEGECGKLVPQWNFPGGECQPYFSDIGSAAEFPAALQKLRSEAKQWKVWRADVYAEYLTPAIDNHYTFIVRFDRSGKVAEVTPGGILSRTALFCADRYLDANKDL